LGNHDVTYHPGRDTATLQGHTGGVLTIAYAPDGKTLASGGGENCVHLWDVQTRKVRVTLGRAASNPGMPETDIMGFCGLSFSPDGTYLASGCGDGTASLWNVAGTKEAAILRGHRNTVFSVAFSPDGKLLATAGRSMIKLWDVPPLK
jgi:WD40 repeat protein